MRVLGIDACLGACSVALVDDGRVLAVAREDMARGHVERLAPMVAEVLAEAQATPGTLDRIAVTCGPGGFTGARLGAAFARGLALSAGCQAVGVGTLEALAFPHLPGPVIAVLDGRRNDVFVQVFGKTPTPPVALPVNDLPAFIQHHGSPPVIGPHDLPAIDPVDVALIGAHDVEGVPPVPLYLRAPDAKAARRPVLR